MAIFVGYWPFAGIFLFFFLVTFKTDYIFESIKILSIFGGYCKNQG